MQRQAPDGAWYTRDEFVQYYGGDTEWNQAAIPALPRLKLLYFDARGLAETTRYMLAWAHVPYEDVRYPLRFGTPGDVANAFVPTLENLVAKLKRNHDPHIEPK